MKHLFLALLLLAGSLPAQVTRTALCDPTDPQMVEQYELVSVTAEVVETPTGKALEVVFGHDSDWPHIKFDAPKAYKQIDWSKHNVLAITVSNATDKVVKANVRVDDSPEADGGTHCRQGSCEVVPGSPVEIRFDLSLKQIEGMRGQPRRRGVDATPGLWIRKQWPEIDLAHMTAFQIFMAKPKEGFTLRIHKVELLGIETGKVEAFVDRYGQFTDEEWPGKLHADGDFAVRRKQEEQDLATHPAPADRNRFGGWANGPTLKATGRFRAAKHEGKWWFVDPEGKLFWSAGITCVGPSAGGPMLGREQLFTWLPQEGDPLRKFYDTKGKGWLDFGKINLFRKFGEDFPAISHELATRRLPSWGFNTIGNWSDGAVWKLAKVPYTIPLHYRSPRVQITETRLFPDVFSPEFDKAIRKGLVAKAEFKDDPWLLGVFIDNELPWAGWGKDVHRLPATILVSETESQMRQAMLDDLRGKYKAIAKLNDVWGTAFASWEVIPGGTKLTKDQQVKAADDLSRFCTILAEKYFSICEQAMRDLMPGVLYLGPRLSSYNPEAVAVAAKHCDVVCFNIYSELPTSRTADEFAMEHDFPVVIGEFHFGALDRGMFHTGLRKAKDQEERAAKFSAYVRTAITSNWCVGTHWFQYRDQALTGRFDGENYNIGFVTITDTPHPEMRAAARKVHQDLYTRRARP
jgi:hypothetical protein